jgi:hypothetical protein
MGPGLRREGSERFAPLGVSIPISSEARCIATALGLNARSPIVGFLALAGCESVRNQSLLAARSWVNATIISVGSSLVA